MTPLSGAIAYDFMLVPGGAEQVTLEFWRGLEHPDLLVGGVGPAYERLFREHPARLHALGRVSNSALPRVLGTMRTFTRNAWRLEKYDWVLFSGCYAPLAVINRERGANILYCHTLPRFAYDLREYYESMLPSWQKPAFSLLVRYVRKHYARAVGRMDSVVCNSRNVRLRLEKYLGVEAEVVYPPCDLSDYVWREQGDYYVSGARLEPYKRVESIVRAFKRMPDKKLVVASGGGEEEMLRALAGDAANIRFAGWLSKADLARLVGGAIATIYLPRDEDFGLSPLESMAAGKPVIGVAEGGLLETVINGETGILLPADFELDDLCAAVRSLDGARARGMRDACERRAGLFRLDDSISRMRELIEAAAAC